MITPAPKTIDKMKMSIAEIAKQTDVMADVTAKVKRLTQPLQEPALGGP